MARISRENDPEHLAALKTPKSKSEKKPSGFKDFFKGGRSRLSLPTSTSRSSLAASPPAPMRHGGEENMAPGFEQVGLLPVQRSRILDLEEWEKVKEENRNLSHAAKIQLYKQREELKRRQADKDEEVVRKLFNVGAQANRKDEGSLEKEDAAAEHGNINTKYEGTVADDHEKASSECEQNLTHEDNSDGLEADQTYHSCVPSTSTSIKDGSDLLHMMPSASQDDLSNSSLSDATALPEAHSTINRSSSWSNLHDEQQEQLQPAVWVSETTDPSENDVIPANSPWSSAQPIAGAISRSKLRFLRGNFKEGPKVGNESSTITTGLVRADWGFPRNTQTFKLGPFALDPNIATALISMPAMLYTAILFVVAMQGPLHFMDMVWRLGVLSVAYKYVGSLLGWREDGSRDILLVPAEEVCVMVKGFWMVAMATFFEGLAGAIAAVLEVTESDNEM